MPSRHRQSVRRSANTPQQAPASAPWVNGVTGYDVVSEPFGVRLRHARVARDAPKDKVEEELQSDIAAVFC